MPLRCVVHSSQRQGPSTSTGQGDFCTSQDSEVTDELEEFSGDPPLYMNTFTYGWGGGQECMHATSTSGDLWLTQDGSLPPPCGTQGSNTGHQAW